MSNDLCINIPKLSTDSSNWDIYRDWMLWTMNSGTLSNHLTNDSMPVAYRAAGGSVAAACLATLSQSLYLI